tara:strand:- start:9 stop:230 length:222 start_codon:yes stop_codon:yes gene_type:complete
MLKADGFDKAIIGVGMRCGQTDVLIYDVDECIDILVQRDKMSYNEAMEYMEFNVLGSWVGEETPIFMRPYEEE